MNNGFIKLYRSIQDNPLWDTKPYDRARAWIDLLLLANHKDAEVLIKGDVYTCKRGQVLRSIKYFESRWGWSRQKVRTFLNMLQKLKMIDKNLTTNLTHLTICNYRDFQDTSTIKQPLSNHSATTYNKGKNSKNIKSIPNFDIFWLKYPNKKSKKKAQQIWKSKKLESKFNEIISGLDRYIKSDSWNSDGGAYIPHPTTFLNQERWLDDIKVKAPQLTPEDIREINEKKENRRLQSEWIKSEKNQASQEDIKNILGKWVKGKQTL